MRRTIVETTKARTGNGTRFVVKPYPKSGQQRRIAIDEDLSTSVHRSMCERELGPEDRLFTRPEGATPSRNYFRTAVWRPALDQAGLPHRRFHDLRASHISWLLAGGADLPAVMARVLDQGGVAGRDVDRGEAEEMLRHRAAHVECPP